MQHPTFITWRSVHHHGIDGDLMFLIIRNGYVLYEMALLHNPVLPLPILEHGKRCIPHHARGYYHQIFQDHKRHTQSNTATNNIESNRYDYRLHLHRKEIAL